MSADVTLLTVGGEEKISCRTGDVEIYYPDKQKYWHGRLSWSLAQALLNTEPQSTWAEIIFEMTKLIEMQPWEQPILFCGQPTRKFGLKP